MKGEEKGKGDKKERKRGEGSFNLRDGRRGFAG